MGPRFLFFFFFSFLLFLRPFPFFVGSSALVVILVRWVQNFTITPYNIMDFKLLQKCRHLYITQNKHPLQKGRGEAEKIKIKKKKRKENNKPSSTTTLFFGPCIGFCCPMLLLISNPPMMGWDASVQRYWTPLCKVSVRNHSGAVADLPHGFVQDRIVYLSTRAFWCPKIVTAYGLSSLVYGLHAEPVSTIYYLVHE